MADRQSERDAVSTKSRGSQRPGTTASNRVAQMAGQNMMDTQSQKSVASSRMSGASRLSKPSVAEIRGTKIQGPGSKAGSQADAMSWTSSQQAQTEVMEDLNEEDEWTAIMKFNTLLHYEEQKQALLRDKERKRLIRGELDN